MTQVQFDFSQAISSGANTCDYFGRVTIGDPRIAADLLRYYTDLVQYVPDEIVVELNKRTDATALESLVILSAQCTTIDEFAKALK